jgi:hypothetical protein
MKFAARAGMALPMLVKLARIAYPMFHAAGHALVAYAKRALRQAHTGAMLLLTAAGV